MSSVQNIPEHTLQDLIIFQGNEIVRLRDELATALVRLYCRLNYQDNHAND
jgi:hypothetical protein